MKLADRIFRIAASRWTERICFVLILFAAQSRAALAWWIAGSAVALTVGAFIAGSIGPLREARRAGRDFPHTPEYRAYVRSRRPDADERSRHRIELEQQRPLRPTSAAKDCAPGRQPNDVTI